VQQIIDFRIAEPMPEHAADIDRAQAGRRLALEKSVKP